MHAVKKTTMAGLAVALWVGGGGVGFAQPLLGPLGLVPKDTDLVRGSAARAANDARVVAGAFARALKVLQAAQAGAVPTAARLLLTRRVRSAVKSIASLAPRLVTLVRDAARWLRLHEERYGYRRSIISRTCLGPRREVLVQVRGCSRYALKNLKVKVARADGSFRTIEGDIVPLTGEMDLRVFCSLDPSQSSRIDYFVDNDGDGKYDRRKDVGWRRSVVTRGASFRGNLVEQISCTGRPQNLGDF